MLGLRTWTCALVAASGTIMLILDDGGSVNVGDAWSLGAALTSAVYIIRLGRAGEQDATHLASATLVFTTLGCWVTTFAVARQTGRSVVDDAVQLLEGNTMQLVYLSVVVTAATGWLQVYGQAAVPPEQASVIYSLDAAYAPVFAWLLLGERLHWLGRLGVALVVASNLLMRLPWEQWASCGSCLVGPRSSLAATGGKPVSPTRYVPLLGLVVKPYEQAQLKAPSPQRKSLYKPVKC